ncbi:uncharacterized protein BDZ83DRAFT_644040 [Colletotrichum acutatum]|uniref:Secreted protein n=1 Tax=Glomerella acutata TaxID=27357 RepID=A0AAD8U7W6_GLOAC|nr:uncharacterized protein BDZ83DRAFT_644040 [Colletotrichum acutatum]KAK1705649.1 hypothetical protein BDZ83DRAFT_644040 [Colletotrichum acutatum]
MARLLALAMLMWLTPVVMLSTSTVALSTSTSMVVSSISMAVSSTSIALFSTAIAVLRPLRPLPPLRRLRLMTVACPLSLPDHIFAVDGLTMFAVEDGDGDEFGKGSFYYGRKAFLEISRVVGKVEGTGSHVRSGYLKSGSFGGEDEMGGS